MTPAEARAAFLWGLTDDEDVLAAAKQDTAAAAELFGVSQRTVQRMVTRFYPCPGPRCLTNVRGGGLCSFCRRTP